MPGYDCDYGCLLVICEGSQRTSTAAPPLQAGSVGGADPRHSRPRPHRRDHRCRPAAARRRQLHGRARAGHYPAAELCCLPRPAEGVDAALPWRRHQEPAMKIAASATIFIHNGAPAGAWIMGAAGWVHIRANRFTPFASKRSIAPWLPSASRQSRQTTRQSLNQKPVNGLWPFTRLKVIARSLFD